MDSVSACSLRERRSRTLRSSRRTSIGPLGALHRPEEDFNLEFVRIASVKLHDLIKPFLSNRVLRQLEGLVLALDDGVPHRPLPLLIAFDTGFQRDAKEDQRRRHLTLLCQTQQILSSLGSQRRGVYHAQPVQRQPLHHQEVDQVKGLLVETLIAFIVANESASPIRRNDLGGPKVPFGKR
jgi:hypothetical protein